MLATPTPRKHQRLFWIIALGLVALFLVDRSYLLAVSTYTARHLTHHSEPPQHIQKNLHATSAVQPAGPVAGLLADIEKFIEHHEKTLIVLGTLAIAGFTYTLWKATDGLFRMARQQSRDMQESLVIARSTSMPFLRVKLDKFRLHPPLGEEPARRPSVRVSLENIGSTPAILQRVGAKLYLTDTDDTSGIPDTLQYNEDAILRSDVIPPKETKVAKEWLFERMLNTIDIELLLASGTKHRPFRRFYLRGFVVYDDIFNVRHTNEFLFKIRQTGWHQQRGGEKYNRVSHATIGFTMPSPEGE